jgi:hypothetical protein
MNVKIWGRFSLSILSVAILSPISLFSCIKLTLFGGVGSRQITAVQTNIFCKLMATVVIVGWNTFIST